MSIRVAKFLDVASGLQPRQFSVGSRYEIASLDDLDPTYKQLLDRPIACVLAVISGDGRPNLTPMWFDYEGDKVLINLATHRGKYPWIRKNPQLTLLLVNPDNAYHWVSIRCTANEELSEDDPAVGERVTAQLDRIWTKYTQQPPPYGLRDPSIDERRALFVCDVERVATFGQP
jgi:PPOX class probable F420-dependent enzyme